MKVAQKTVGELRAEDGSIGGWHFAIVLSVLAALVFIVWYVIDTSDTENDAKTLLAILITPVAGIGAAAFGVKLTADANAGKEEAEKAKEVAEAGKQQAEQGQTQAQAAEAQAKSTVDQVKRRAAAAMDEVDVALAALTARQSGREADELGGDDGVGRVDDDVADALIRLHRARGLLEAP